MGSCAHVNLLRRAPTVGRGNVPGVAWHRRRRLSSTRHRRGPVGHRPHCSPCRRLSRGPMARPSLAGRPSSRTPRSRRLLRPGAVMLRLATGAVWSEGPVWLPQDGSVLWSDIPNDRLLRWHAATVACRCSWSPPSSRTATRSTTTGRSSPAPMATGESSASRSTARSRRSSSATRASGSTPRTT